MRRRALVSAIALISTAVTYGVVTVTAAQAAQPTTIAIIVMENQNYSDVTACNQSPRWDPYICDNLVSGTSPLHQINLRGGGVAGKGCSNRSSTAEIPLAQRRNMRT
jgi:hypothetical protein